ncbi:MAG: hypothetical protein KF774_16065 [Planctomyces sp.]|nr:hypothetical protein [Planctomyces sp.]
MIRRHVRHRSDAIGFGSREMTRIASLTLLLAVMVMLYFRARDPVMWRWFANDPDQAAVDDGEAALDVPESAAAGMQVLEGPDDTDPDEQAAFRESLASIADNQSLTADEMFAYWRLFEWTRRSSFEDLWRRSRKDLLFTHLFGSPEHHRGELVGLRLNVQRVLKHDPSPDAPEDVDVYEIWGRTSESGTFPYCLIVNSRPEGLPLGAELNEEARFAGYFLKVMSYEDKLGTRRGAPLLIGRADFIDNPGRRAFEARRQGSPWTFWAVAGLFATYLIVRAVLRKRPHTEPARLQRRTTDEGAVRQWLDDATEDSQSPDPPRGESS